MHVQSALVTCIFTDINNTNIKIKYWPLIPCNTPRIFGVLSKFKDLIFQDIVQLDKLMQLTWQFIFLVIQPFR